VRTGIRPAVVLCTSTVLGALVISSGCAEIQGLRRVCSSVPSHAQTKLEVTVLYDGVPIPDCRVMILDRGTGQLIEANTDESGTVQVELSAGDHTVTADWYVYRGSVVVDVRAGCVTSFELPLKNEYKGGAPDVPLRSQLAGCRVPVGIGGRFGGRRWGGAAGDRGQIGGERLIERVGPHWESAGRSEARHRSRRGRVIGRWHAARRGRAGLRG
jgi:hypothetical protein